jgi:hypothetical protein
MIFVTVFSLFFLGVCLVGLLATPVTALRSHLANPDAPSKSFSLTTPFELIFACAATISAVANSGQSWLASGWTVGVVAFCAIPATWILLIFEASILGSVCKIG